MKIEYDFEAGKIKFDYGEPYHIESLRRYAVNYHPNTLKNYFIKCIKHSGGYIFTYDFDAFFQDIDIPFLRQYKRYLTSCYDDHVRPVSGITQTSDCLDDIFLSVKKQFVVEDHNYKLLRGGFSDKSKQFNQYPLTAFIGIADMHGFTPSVIMEEAQMDAPSSSNHFMDLLSRFKTEIKEGVSVPNRLYNKTRLVLNELRAKYEKYVDLGDFGH